MATLFEKQIQFTRNVKAAGRLREFNFLKLRKTETPAYHIDVADERGNRYEFTFLQEEKNWKIIGDGVPKWVFDTVEELEREVVRPDQPLVI